MQETLYFVTGSEGKATEAAAIVPGLQRIKLDMPELQSLDVEEVLRGKLLAAHQQEPDKWLVVEDTTYSVAGLGGLPGTLIKWFEERLYPEGIYEICKDRDTSTVVAANLGLIKPDGSMLFVKGEVQGKTVSPVAGEGFGFDAIFMPDGESQRYSEMGQAAKNKTSHRYKAWMALKELLDS